MTASRRVAGSFQHLDPAQLAQVRPVIGAQPLRPTSTTVGVTPAVARQLNMPPPAAGLRPISPGPVIRGTPAAATGFATGGGDRPSGAADTAQSSLAGRRAGRRRCASLQRATRTAHTAGTGAGGAAADQPRTGCRVPWSHRARATRDQSRWRHPAGDHHARAAGDDCPAGGTAGGCACAAEAYGASASGGPDSATCGGAYASTAAGSRVRAPPPPPVVHTPPPPVVVHAAPPPPVRAAPNPTPQFRAPPPVVHNPPPPPQNEQRKRPGEP